MTFDKLEWYGMVWYGTPRWSERSHRFICVKTNKNISESAEKLTGGHFNMRSMCAVHHAIKF